MSESGSAVGSADMRANLEAARMAALRAYLIAEDWLEPGDEIEPDTSDGCRFAIPGSDWLIVTDEEADERAAEYIRESLWAFNADFLAPYMPDGIDAMEIEAVRGDRFESANPAMLALVGGRLDDLTEDAIGADGRGHFMADYAGEEREHSHDGRDWYVYRV
jgi:hypothetical protein